MSVCVTECLSVCHCVGLGGTCVNVGCIPKKLMHQTALLRQFILLIVLIYATFGKCSKEFLFFSALMLEKLTDLNENVN